MSQPKWTPGPWRVGALPPPEWRYICDEAWEVVAAVAKFNDDGTLCGDFKPKEARANALLIAAAPLLAEAAEAAELLLHDLRMCTTKEEAWKILCSDQDPVSVVHEDARAALAAARGEGQR